MTSEERRAWLSQLKVGDEVAVDYGFGNVRIESITRVTATQITAEGDKYRRSDGRKMGPREKWSGRNEIRPIDSSVKDILDRERFSCKFYEYRKLADKLPIATVRKLLAVLAEAEGEGKEST